MSNWVCPHCGQRIPFGMLRSIMVPQCSQGCGRRNAMVCMGGVYSETRILNHKGHEGDQIAELQNCGSAELKQQQNLFATDHTDEHG